MRRSRRPSGKAVKRSAAVSAGLAAIVTIGTIVILASPGGSESAGSCGRGDWPATAYGSPRIAADAYYAWYNAKGWHLRFKAAAGSRLNGRVTADARIGLATASAMARKGLKAQGRTLSFTFAATGATERIDFKASCASKLSFQFGSTASADRTGHGPSSANLPVFLGARGHAPTPSFLLRRPVLTGVAGRIVIGPTCPIVTPSCPPAKPGKGTVRIETAPRSKRDRGQLVKLVKSDQQGKFSTTLPAGHYVLVVEKNASHYPVPKPLVVEVETGVVSQVTLVLDTGIR